MKLADQPFLFLDCQTTGATPQSANILELGWYLTAESYGPTLNSHTKMAIKSRLIRQPDDQVLPMRIQKITGITAEQMHDAHLASDVVSELLRDLVPSGQAKVRFAVAHYAQFEHAFVNQLFADHLPGQGLPFDFICTCQIAKRLYPDLPSRAIRALGGYFGFSLSEMKRSSGHVEATYFIWQRLLADLAAIGIEEDDQLLEWLRQPLPKVSAKVKKNPYAIPMERLKRLDLPSSPGIYRMLNCDGNILYVGKATSLKSRVNSYFRGRKGKDSKTKELISQIFDIAVDVVATPLEAALLETDLIKKYDPPYNRALRQRGRVLNFYSADFTQVSLQQDSVHIFGPFVSDTFKPLLDFLQALRSKTYPPELFWGLAGEELIAKAFDLVFEDGPLAKFKANINDKADINDKANIELTARRLLAIGMSLVRQEVNFLRAAKREQARLEAIAALDASLLSDSPEEPEPEEPESDDTHSEGEREIDENDLIEMIYGILARSAKLHLQAKKLTSLLNSRVSFSDGGVSRTLTFIAGQLVASDGVSLSRSALPWAALEIDTYDRMRVLLSEMARVSQKGKHFEIVDLKGITAL